MVLPQEESETAIKESEAAAAESTSLMQQAKSYIIQKLQEVKRYSRDPGSRFAVTYNVGG